MATRRLLLFMCPLLLTISGCSDLILRDSDSAGKTTGKVLARSLPPEQQAREYALEQARIQAAGQALHGILA